EPAGPGQPARHALDGPRRLRRRHARDAGRGLDRLLGLARLHPHADPGRRVAVRPRPHRHAGLHPRVVRICSLLPSASEVVAALGHTDSLVGVSEECRMPGKPVVTAARIDPAELTSAEIDEAVRASVLDGRSLYALEAALVEELRPDLVVTQDLCSVCAVSGGDVASALPLDVEV